MKRYMNDSDGYYPSFMMIEVPDGEYVLYEDVMKAVRREETDKIEAQTRLTIEIKIKEQRIKELEQALGFFRDHDWVVKLLNKGER